jgi:hypothetical protein
VSLPSGTTETRRWVVLECGDCEQTKLQDDGRAFEHKAFCSAATQIEVMPVSEHEKLREAALSLLSAADTPCVAEETLRPFFERLRAALNGSEER